MLARETYPQHGTSEILTITSSLKLLLGEGCLLHETASLWVTLYWEAQLVYHAHDEDKRPIKRSLQFCFNRPPYSHYTNTLTVRSNSYWNPSTLPQSVNDYYALSSLSLMTINYCCYVVTARNLPRTMSNDGFGTSSIRHLGSTTSVYSMIAKMIISPSSLLLPSPPPTLVPIINKRMKVYDMKQVFNEITRERYHQDNSLTIPIVLYLCVCFTAGYAKSHHGLKTVA